MIKPIAIVGGGFSGLLLASVLGDEVVVFEEHDKVGRPPHCTGLVSLRTFRSISRLTGIGSEVIEGYFNELMIKPLSVDDYVVLKLSEPVVKLDRVRIEELLANIATSKGALIKVNHVVTKVSPDGTVLVKNQVGRFSTVFIAEGSSLRLCKFLNLCGKVIEKLVGAQYLLKCYKCPDEGIYVLTSSKLTKFFGWLISYDKKLLLGLITRKDPSIKLKYLLKMAVKEFNLNIKEVIKVFGGPIVIGYPRLVPYLGNVFAIGDAALMVKPISGGGLYGAVRQVMAISKSFNPPKDLSKSKYLRLMLTTVLNIYSQIKLLRLILSTYGTYDSLIRSLIRSGIKDVKVIDYDNHLLNVLTNLVKLLT
ncbi:MAG: hypothetical protein DRO18_02250 [Thermoprotei archaeon]|nr:MAG: hypothetical protein DRO18_02250 [Thermoprotei archaeon]